MVQSGVTHTAISPNGGVHINTYNRLGSLFSEKFTKTVGTLGRRWTNYFQ